LQDQTVCAIYQSVKLPFLELPQLLPRVLDWVEAQEKQALNQGISLSPVGLNDARTVGVADPEKIRVYVVPEIPQPDHPKIKQIAAEVGLITPRTIAITFGHGIFVRTDHSADRLTLVHECAHVAQYEKLGIEDFLAQYVMQVFKNGYEHAPMEREACEAAQRVTSGG
jgi:hypothetical protein